MDYVHAHDSVQKLLKVLCNLRVVEYRRHKISHAYMMIANQQAVPKHWIQLPTTSMHAEFVEIVPARKALQA